MSNDTINDVRSILMETLRDLRKTGTEAMELDRAKTIVAVAGVLVDSAKVEVEAIKALGGVGGTGFVPVDNGLPKPQPKLPVRQ